MEYFFLLCSREGLGMGSCQKLSESRLARMFATMLAVMLAPGLVMRGDGGSPSTVVVAVVVVVEVELTLSLNWEDGGVRMPYWVPWPVPGAEIPGIAVDRRMFSGAGGDVGLDEDE